MARKPVVIVTGASKGIGLAVARILLDKFNSNVVAISRTRTPELGELHNAHAESLMVHECNVTDTPSLNHAISLAEKKFHHIDGLILNAGVLNPLGKVTSPDVSIDDWKSHFDVNFFSLVAALRATLPALRESSLGGRVVFVSSGAAVSNISGWGPYNAGKAAMNSLCRTIANEEPAVTFVALRPGRVDTPMQAVLRAEGAGTMADTVHQDFVQAHAEGKLVKPEDCGHVIASLALNATKDLTGEFVAWDSEPCKPYRK
ncbi:short-chain dehydrogenase [Cristinia sonorae]|uniref:Short-chain dehydrogenase n=1 Tax=Cristinia sonorae TaxID=1940300 RepID=A0A8K0UX68_9AGAR|nr:short-chain dehydrogenase [Cristinia sonorae]